MNVDNRSGCPPWARKPRLRRDDIRQFQRARLRREPLLAGRGAPHATLVERQLQRAQQRLDLLARRDMRQARPRAERLLVEAVERGQSPRIELAEDHAFGETVDRAEAEPQRKLL